MPASRRARYQNGRLRLRGRAGSFGDGKTKGLAPRGLRSRIRRAWVLRGTVLGPVLLSARTSLSWSTSDQRSRTISLLRHPVRSSSRMISACSRLLLRVCLSRTRWSRAISSRDRKRSERLSPVPLHGQSGVRIDVTAGDREVHDLAEKIERVIGVAGGGPTEAVEPMCDLHQGDAVERLRTEGRQQLAVERGSHALPGGRLVSFEMGFLPRALDEIPEERSHPPGRASRLRLRACLARMALAAGLCHGLQRHRAERDAPCPPASVLQQDIAPPAGGPNPDAEAGDKAVPNRIFPRAGSEAGDGAVGEPYAFPGGPWVSPPARCRQSRRRP